MKVIMILKSTYVLYALKEKKTTAKYSMKYVKKSVGRGINV